MAMKHKSLELEEPGCIYGFCHFIDLQWKSVTLPLQASVFSFLKWRLEWYFPLECLWRKKKVLNAYKMGNKVPSTKSALNISLLLLIISLDVDYFCLWVLHVMIRQPNLWVQNHTQEQLLLRKSWAWGRSPNSHVFRKSGAPALQLSWLGSF